MTNRENAPLEKVEIKDKVRAFAKEHGLMIDPKFEHKIQWSEEHGGRCYCDWDSDRRCPCSHCMADLKRFNGNCMCSVLITPEKLRQKEKNRNKPTWIKIADSVAMKNNVIYDLNGFEREKKEQRKTKEAEAKQLLEKLIGKKKKRKVVV